MKGDFPSIITIQPRLVPTIVRPTSMRVAERDDGKIVNHQPPDFPASVTIVVAGGTPN
jgi:hypothetical protein